MDGCLRALRRRRPRRRFTGAGIAGRWLALWLLAAVATAPGEVAAHPHGWIDLRSRVLFDDEGQVAAFEFEWLFDEFYTLFIAEEFIADGRPPSEFLAEIASTNLANLAEYDYFADVKLDGQPVAVGEVTQYETGLRDERLWLRFSLPLLDSVDPHSARLTFAVYDPTYYIEVLHEEGEPIVLSGPGSDGCSAEIEPPNPSFSDIAFASALDRTQSAGDGLGEVFAETVLVDCR